MFRPRIFFMNRYFSTVNNKNYINTFYLQHAQLSTNKKNIQNKKQIVRQPGYQKSNSKQEKNNTVHVINHQINPHTLSEHRVKDNKINEPVHDRNSITCNELTIFLSITTYTVYYLVVHDFINYIGLMYFNLYAILAPLIGVKYGPLPLLPGIIALCIGTWKFISVLH